MTVHWPVQVPILVRERDCGPQGELDESALVVFFREARRAYLSVLNAGEEPCWSRVQELRIGVLRLASVDDDLAVRIRCDGVGRETFRFRYLVRDRVTDEVVAEATTVQALEAHLGLGLFVSQEFRARLSALEGRMLPDLDACESEIDDASVISNRFAG